MDRNFSLSLSLSFILILSSPYFVCEREDNNVSPVRSNIKSIFREGKERTVTLCATVIAGTSVLNFHATNWLGWVELCPSHRCFHWVNSSVDSDANTCPHSPRASFLPCFHCSCHSYWLPSCIIIFFHFLFHLRLFICPRNISIHGESDVCSYSKLLPLPHIHRLWHSLCIDVWQLIVKCNYLWTRKN